MAALSTLPLLAARTGSLPLLALALLVAGMATAPTMVTGMTLVQRRTPAGRLNEGMTLAVTALLGGIATGSATGGWAVEALGNDGWAYAVPTAAATVAATLAALTARRAHTTRTTPTPDSAHTAHTPHVDLAHEATGEAANNVARSGRAAGPHIRGE